MSKIGWNFPTNGGGGYDGFNDAGIETFAGKPFESLGREILQNSLDAVDVEKEAPVIVNFERVDVDTSDLPGHEELQSAMGLCQDQDQAKDDDKVKKFFKKAKKLLGKETIPVLAIEDYNTTGLRYDTVHKTRSSFYAITKGTGISNKQDDTAAGSYGIGQCAPFAVSGLRTVYYSTLYNDSHGEHELFQGKSVLISHDNPDHGETRGTGFYGIKDQCEPLLDLDIHVPDWCRRRQDREDNTDFQGTSVFVTGFGCDSDWKERLAAAVIESFFLAIQDNKLIIKIDGKYRIDQDTLPELFDNEDIVAVSDGMKTAKQYYKTSRDPHERRETESSVLGHCELKIRIEENALRKVALFRNSGMQITDSQQGLRRFPSFKDFTAIFECKSTKGNELLRKMEPPCHDHFEPARLGDDEAKGVRALKEIRKWIRDQIQNCAAPETAKQHDLDELAEFLPDRDPEESLPGKDHNEERNPEGNPTITLKPVKRKVPSFSPDNEGAPGNAEGGDGGDGGDEEGFGSDTSEGDGGNRDGGGGDGSDGSNGGSRSKNPFRIEHVRLIGSDSDPRSKTIIFTPTETGRADLRIEVAGDAATELLTVESVGDGREISNGCIRGIELQKNTRTNLEVQLSHPYEGAVRVIAYAV